MMNYSKRHLSTLVVLCLLISPTLTYADTHSRDIALVFDWPEGLSGVVNTIEEVTKVHGKKKSVSSFSRKASFTSTKHADGLLMRYFDKELKILSSDTTAENPVPIPRDAFLTQSNLMISTDGKLIDMLDIETELEVLNEKYKKDILRIYPNMPDTERQALLDDYALIYSKNNILEENQSNWNVEYSQWSGVSLSMDSSAKLEDSLQLLAVGGAELPASGQYEFQGRLLCRPHHIEKYCVKVSYSAELTSESVGRMNKMLSVMLDVKKVSNSSDVLTVELTADAETLLPYQLVKKHTSRSELGFFGRKWMFEKKVTTDFRYN